MRRYRFSQWRPIVVRAFLLDGLQLLLADGKMLGHRFIGFAHALAGILRGDQMREDFLFFLSRQSASYGHEAPLNEKSIVMADSPLQASSSAACWTAGIRSLSSSMRSMRISRTE